MIFGYMLGKTLWNTTVMYCEKYTVDDVLQQSLGFTPRSTVARG
jgi:hypothetical protein